MPKVELPKSLLEHTTWEEETNPIWSATSYILRRNLARYNFPSKLSEPQTHQILDILRKTLLNSKSLQNPTLLPAEEISALDKEFLYEHFLYLQSLQNTLSGQAFIVDDSYRFLALLNVEDHLQLEWMDSKGEWEKSWEKLNTLEMAISSTLDFAFTPRFGYLTSDPTNCGTALTILSYLHLPALIFTGQLPEVLLKQGDEDITATGLQGTVGEYIGDFVVLHNRFTFGIPEDSILHSLQTSTMKLMLAEKALRSRIQKESDPTFKDHVSRAYGLLMHSYQLHEKEALDALSMIKLGIDLGFASGITDNKLNDIFFRCRRGHLAHLFPEKSLDPQQIAHRRTEYLHQQLKDVKLEV